MTKNYVILAIPGFFILMALEILIMKIRRQNFYRIGDSINSISLGVLDQIIAALVGFGPGMALYGLAARLSATTLDSKSPWVWVAAILLGDFIYYWWHRASHRINFMWAAHVIHHQSEEYNLSTALRQSWAAQFTIAFFFLPMAALGFPFEVYFGSLGLNLLYQFWIHTRTIKKMGPLEWIFNTPSHHRVHHGVNPEYLDKNYAGILIVWDRMFGTFVEEKKEVVYGTVKPIASWNPIWNNLEYWVELFRRSCSERSGVWKRLKHWFMPPEWTAQNPHPTMNLREYRPSHYKKFEVRFSKKQRSYQLTLFSLTLLCAAAFLNLTTQRELSVQVRLVVVLVIALILRMLSEPQRIGDHRNRT